MTLAVMAAVAMVTVGAHAASFSGMVVFGDSLSDSGNLFTFTGEAVPASPPYFEGRFSNGPVWVEDLLDRLNAGPDQLHADPDQLRQVLDNLVANARQAMEAAPMKLGRVRTFVDDSASAKKFPVRPRWSCVIVMTPAALSA